MGVVTSIAAATVAVGGSVLKGVLAGDAASSAAREAGDLRLQQAELEKEAVARLEQDFFEGVRVNTDIYDKALEMSNVKGAELVQAAQEGDQRGVAATAGKVKAIEQAGLSALSDQFSKEKLEIDLNRAKANELSAAEIAAMQNDRAAAAGLRSDALMAQSDKLRGDAVGNFIGAGVSAVTMGVDIATEISAGKDQAAIDKLVAGGNTLEEAQKIVADASKAARRDYMGGNANAFGTAPPLKSDSNTPLESVSFDNFNSFKSMDTSLDFKSNSNPFLNPSGMKNFFPGLDTKNIFNTDYTSMKNNQVYDDFMKTFEYQQGRGI
jgi:hypothetical protein